MDYDEKRHFVRVDTENVIAYSVLKADGSVDMARSGYVHSKNVSKGGILFSSFECLTVGVTIQMKLRFCSKPSHNETVAMIGNVVRTNECIAGKKWDIGVKIKYIEQAKEEIFNNWLNNKLPT
ncbi:MAG: PilZ domain-containing protein [Candidatus Aureabacteria bacterium]|nr:PilZ domain-containing protein [Candidatus Auribacterota bacterium]